MKPELTESVIEVQRVSDRVSEIKLEMGKGMVNVASAYALQAGCDKGEKEEFWTTMDEVVYAIP